MKDSCTECLPSHVDAHYAKTFPFRKGKPLIILTLRNISKNLIYYKLLWAVEWYYFEYISFTHRLTKSSVAVLILIINIVTKMYESLF